MGGHKGLGHTALSQWQLQNRSLRDGLPDFLGRFLSFHATTPRSTAVAYGSRGDVGGFTFLPLLF